ncbi:LLM class flavin-dependent oxidoreductase [Streptomyces griseoruber]|uniref:LLM class flavin-dependent oxidoreductase n=1 Tax=Streptomyces griseoruber TaxID=1943 RepID=UPI0037B45675
MNRQDAPRDDAHRSRALPSRVFFHPERAAEVRGPALAEGSARRDPACGAVDVVVSPPLAIGEDVEDLIGLVRPQLALYLGGMGAPGKNFHNDLARRYGFGGAAATVQELYLSGRKDEAAAAVLADLLRATSLIGPASYVAERLAAFRAAGVTSLQVRPMAHHTAQRLADVEKLGTTVC